MATDTDRRVSEALAPYGLDLRRYSPRLVESFARSFTPTLSAQASHVEIIRTFSIGETSFLRFPEQFETLRFMLPTLTEAAGGRPLRALSAGCATGEEAFSLAATLRGLGAGGYLVHGLDLNPQAIERARLAQYRPWSLRGVDLQTTADWLLPAPSGVRVAPFLQKSVNFSIANLCSDPLPAECDIIFCRNVLLYFSGDAAQHVLHRLSECLSPGGVLFLGYHDPLPAPELPLVLHQLERCSYYRRTDAHVRDKPPHALEQPVIQAREAPQIHSLEPEQSLLACLDTARALAGARDFGGALEVLERVTCDHPMSTTAHVLTALVAEDAGRHGLMLRAARSACFLEPDEPAPNFFLSIAFARTGNRRRERVHRAIARATLSERKYTGPVPFAEGLTATLIRRMVDG